MHLPQSQEAASQGTLPSSIPRGLILSERYLIGPIIGEGGMGTVCEAFHLGLDTPVAIKVLRPDLRDSPEFVQRFLNEGRAAASLKGEHIARVYDVGQLDSGEPYLVMERLDGIPLETFIEESGPLAAADAANWVMEACEGLAEAHALSLVHRDIKPANLFLARRAGGNMVLKILDFGISKRLSPVPGKTLTDPGRSLGSPWYMAPEQMRNAARVDQRADIWSVGVLLFELLTKQPPFDGEGVPEVCAKVLTDPTPSLRALVPEIDPDLEAIVLRCLEKDAERRYQSVTALMRDLAPHTSRVTPLPTRHTLGSLAPIADELKLGRRSRSRLPVAIALAAVAGGALGLLGLPGKFDWQGLGRRVQQLELRLPWDPVLGASPLETGVLDRRFEAPALIAKTTPSAAAAARTRSAARTAGGEIDPQQIRRRNENYEQWLKSQGLTRIDDLDVDLFGKPVLEVR